LRSLGCGSLPELMSMKRQFQPKGSQSGRPTGWKNVKTSLAQGEARTACE
jgi:hypothetical protein